ncbi:Global transcription regulator sge1 [Coemansia sp. BCRC 34301]|nr:Global transcription regulator sge1 [Coemansia sp. BCRC 34301]
MSINVSAQPSSTSGGGGSSSLRPIIDPCTVVSTLDTSPGEVVVGGPSACFTVTGLKVTSTRDAMMIFEACRRGVLPRVVRRLHDNEKQAIDAGTVVVFDEREAKMKRWTDGRLWTPSRIVNNFLLYRELQQKMQPGQEGAAEVGRWTRNARSRHPGSYGSSKGVFVPKEHGLIKRTISLTVPDNETEFLQGASARVPARIHQQHLIAYSYAEGEAQLPAPEDMEELQSLRLPQLLLHIQKFRRPIRIALHDDTYDLVETDDEQEDGNDVTPIHKPGGNGRRVYGSVADIPLMPLAPDLTLPLAPPAQQPKIDPLGMEPPTAANSLALASRLQPPFLEPPPSLGFNPDLYSSHLNIAHHPAFVPQPTEVANVPYYDFTPTGNAVHDVMFGAVGDQQPASSACVYEQHSSLPSSEYMDALYGLQQQQFGAQSHTRVFYDGQRQVPFPMELSHPQAAMSSASSSSAATHEKRKHTPLT